METAARRNNKIGVEFLHTPFLENVGNTTGFRLELVFVNV